jgi:hypothetical protein
VSKTLTSRKDEPVRPNVDVSMDVTFGMSIAQLDIQFTGGPMDGQTIHVAGQHHMVDSIKTLLERVLHGVGVET